MKKLLMFLGMALVLAFSAGNASAVSFGLDIGSPGVPPDGVIDDPAEITIAPSETIDVDIYLLGWAAPPNLGAIDYQFTWDATKISVTGIVAKDLKPAGDALWDADGQYPDGDYVDLSLIEFGVGVAGPDIRLHTVTLHCITEGDAAIGVGSGYLVATTGDDTTPADPVAGVIHQVIPPCTCSVDNGDGEVDDLEPTEQVTASPSITCATPDYTYSDDCAGGDVDPDTGLFTATVPMADETCTITVTDSANAVECDAEMVLVSTPLCDIEIYIGGAPVPPCNTYNKPGRRGLMLTCGDTVQFSECSDCESLGNPDCVNNVWSMAVISGTPPAGTSIDPDTGLLTIGPDCTDLAAPVEIEITVTCPDNGGITDTVSIFIGEVVLSVADVNVAPDQDSVEVEVGLANPNHKVKAIEVDLADPADCLVCTGCAPDNDRALDYTCSANEQVDGSCKVILATFNPSGMIEEGAGTVLTVDYEGDCADCAAITAGVTVNVADQFGDPLCACFEDGEICEFACGDIYPRECLPDDPECGDGVVDIFDILEEIDFILDIIDPSDCQAARADVPTGTPPYCGCIGDAICQVDGVIDVFDLLVIIDMALGKANCCDYCASGTIY